MWKKGFPQYGNCFVIFSTIWKVQYEFSTLGNSQYRFSTTQKLWFKIFHKIGSNFFCSTMCKCFSTEYCIQLIWIPLNDKYCTFVMQKMSKIPHNDNMACKKCWKSRYFCGTILARIIRSRKVYEVFHVWSCIFKIKRVISIFRLSRRCEISLLQNFEILKSCSNF